MTTVHYELATLSFSVDLTAPDASCVPIGVLVLVDLGEARLAVFVGVQPQEQGPLDPITFELLKDVPALVQEHLDQVMRGLPSDVDMRKILTALHTRLRNSIYVSDIQSEKSLDIPDELVAGLRATDDARFEARGELEQRVVGLALRALAHGLREVATPREPETGADPAASPAKMAWPCQMADVDNASTHTWRLPSPGQASSGFAHA